MKILLALLCALLLNACSTTYVKPAPAAQLAEAIQFKATPDKAIVYFYRDGWMGGDNKTGLYVNKMRNATGAQGAFSLIEIEPGKHNLNFTQVVSLVQLEDPAFSIEKEFKAGELYFIEEKWVFAKGFEWQFATKEQAAPKIEKLQLNSRVGRIDGLQN